MTGNPGQLPENSIQKVARLLEESSLGTVGARQLRDRATSGTVARIRCRAYFAADPADEKWWQANQYNELALLHKANDLAAAGHQEISDLLMHLVRQHAILDGGSDITSVLERTLEKEPSRTWCDRLPRQGSQADWRSFRTFYQSRIGTFSIILRERTGLPEETTSILIQRAMAKAFDEWEKLAALNDPEEWVIGYALQLYRRFKLPDEDGSWAHNETFALPGSPCMPSPPSPHECADVRVTGALATAVAEISRPTADIKHISSITHDSYGFYLVRHEPGKESVDTSFSRLYMAHFKPLVGMAVLLILDTGTAEEIVQESFLSLYTTRSRLAHSEERALAYLRQNVVNRSRSVLRYRKVTNQAILSLPVCETHFPSAEEGVIAFSERSAVIAGIQSLPARQREALVLHYYGDLPQSAIADIMGVSKGAVKSYIARAMASLAKLLSQPRNNTNPR